MPIKSIVFTVGCPDPNDLPLPSECRIVPLYPELILDARLSAWNFDNTYHYLGIKEHHEVLVESEKVWKQILRGKDGLNLQDYSQFFFCTATPILFWEKLIQKAINEHQPQELIISSPAEQSTLVLGIDLFKDRDKFLKFMAYSVLEHECKRYGIRIRCVADLRNHKKNQLTNFLNKLSKVYSLVLRCGFGYAYRKVISYAFKNCSFLKNMEAPNGALFISQSRKSERLYKGLTSQKINVAQIDYTDFCNYFMPSELSKESSLALDYSYIKGNACEVLAEWLYFAAKFHENHVQNKINQWIDGNNALILTDGEHDYLIRKLMRSMDIRKRNFFILPEGAGNIVSKDQIRAENILADRGPHAWRVLCSQYQFDVYQQLCHSRENRIAGGYFYSYETFFSSPKKYNRLLKGHKIFTGNKQVIFLDMYLFNVHGIERPIYHLPFDQQLQVIDLFLDAVDLERYSVVANLRHSSFFESLQDRYQDKITIFKDVGWLDLARYSDLIVSRSSSICSEALFLKIPCLIWNPFPEFPDIFEGFASIKSPVLQRATNRDELAQCMNFINKIKDFEKYAMYVSNELNMQHVLQKIVSMSSGFRRIQSN